MIRKAILTVLLLTAAARLHAADLFLEAESFEDKGGWVLDQQFMDEMGSPFLLAHGLGVPVKDATTTVAFPAAGEYHVWVRTRDWVWMSKAPGTAGLFKLVVDGKPLAATFGTEGKDWHWQDGGTVELGAGETTLALHDLTGFEGRCDAVCLSADADFRPPNEGEAMAAWRRKLLGLPDEPEDGGTYDLVVTGGGIAGTCAAVAAARSGLTVAFVQDRPVLGGNNSSEIRVWLQGKTNGPLYPRIGDLVNELQHKVYAHYGPSNTGEIYEDDKKLAVVRGEKGITLLLNHRTNAAEVRDAAIRAVIAQDVISGRRLRLAGRWFVDATGDGCVGALAGADFDITLKGHMGPCNLWNVKDTGQPVSFPRCEWALDLSEKPFPGRNGRGGIEKLGGWYWESGFDHDPIAKGEYIRDWNFRAMYGAWDCLKNHQKLYPNHKLNWSAYVCGKRESRRLLGDVVLTLKDLKEARQFPDACVVTGWPVDLHLGDPLYEKGFEGDAFISHALYTRYPMPFHVPYRCFYSRNISNLFMAGRCNSVTHDALGATRVMKTGGLMGEVVGLAAAVCKKHDTTPRGVYAKHLDELKELMTKGIGRCPPPAKPQRTVGGFSGDSAPPKPPPAPKWLANAGENLARSARLSATPASNKGDTPPALLTDGKCDLADNAQRWLGGGELPHRVELEWDQPQTFNAARIISGYRHGANLSGCLEAFVWEYHDGSTWKEIPRAKAEGNVDVDWHARFEPVRTRKVRLTITATPGGISRVWEVELYNVRE